MTATERAPEQLARTAHHEAAHGVAARFLGFSVRLLSIRPTDAYNGVCSPSLPRLPAQLFNPTLIMQPPALRRALEGRAIVSLAGPIGADLAGPWSGYAPTTDDDAAAAAALGLVGLSDRERGWLEDLESRPEYTTDEDNAAGISKILARGEAARHLAWLRAMTRRMVYRSDFRRAVELVVPPLLERSVLSGRALNRILKNPEGR